MAEVSVIVLPCTLKVLAHTPTKNVDVRLNPYSHQEQECPKAIFPSVAVPSSII